MSEFTPGPWKYSKTSDRVPFSFSGYIVGKDGLAGFWALVKATLASDESRDSEMKANARLIAAAPDMYEALKALRALVGATESDRLCLYEYARKQADAAIAKAEGKP